MAEGKDRAPTVNWEGSETEIRDRGEIATTGDGGESEAGSTGKSAALQERQSRVATAICWERFLRVTSIRVLLVEDDDSTRHIVSALLVNCNYQVIGAANGNEAWKILEEEDAAKQQHIDLVLCEVELPQLSGLDLLCKIMSHNTCRHIPVIMMSSGDSIGLVWKCLSKGAAGFLVKPMRKNELKNLWQHVWRRCHSSAAIGSGSGRMSKVKNAEDPKKMTENSIGHDRTGCNGEDKRKKKLRVNTGEDADGGMQQQVR
ncbi:hypothetical protein DM860_004242 [Cuscuta australis]|uniref:Response regulatory domain-containing protein n=1 Tax=Cuscuta australis TaxID=267555 RepID=A0A328EBB9_9ASTE|nr:hypothetical protein DM860_004242 [Cuscuta australis]